MEYEYKTTFWQDFTIAENYGTSAIYDTFNRAFKEWKDNYIYLTDLVVVLNHKIFDWYRKDDVLTRIYQDLFEEVDNYAYNNLKGEEFNYFIKVTD